MANTVLWTWCLQCVLVMQAFYVLCNIHFCRTQLPAVLLAGQSCQCRYRVSLPLRGQFPSSWMLGTCMQLPEAVVLFFWQPPLIKICPNSSQPAEKPPPHISVPRRPEGVKKNTLESGSLKENVCNNATAPLYYMLFQRHSKLNMSPLYVKTKKNLVIYGIVMLSIYIYIRFIYIRYI